MLIAHPQSTKEIELIATSMQLLTIIPSILFYFIIVCKTPFINDTFYLHWESKIHSKILIAMGFGCILVNAVNLVFDSDILVASTATPILILGFFALNYSSTWWIIYKNVNQRELEKQINHAPDNEHGGDITLDMILTDEKSINLFMQHLAKELRVFDI